MIMDILPVKLEKFRQEQKRKRTRDNRIDKEAFVDGEINEPLPYETKKIFLSIAENCAKRDSQFLSLADLQKIYVEQCLSSFFLLTFTLNQVTNFVKILLPSNQGS